MQSAGMGGRSMQKRAVSSDPASRTQEIDLTMFDINNVNTIQLDTANNSMLQMNSTFTSLPMYNQAYAPSSEGMGDFYNAYHAVWRNRYDNEIMKEGNQIKPVSINSVKRAVSFLQRHQEE